MEKIHSFYPVCVYTEYISLMALCVCVCVCVILFIYLFLALLGLCCRAGLPVVVLSGDSRLVVVCGLLVAMPPLAAEHGLQGARASVVAAYWL